MADLSFTTNNQIIRDLYNTPQEAVEASRELGCNGYRTYIINGETKYVPCSSFVEYESALRYRTVQGKIGAFGSDTFGSKLVGFQFANAKDEISGDPFFTMGNFSIQRSVQLTPVTQLQIQTNESTQNGAVKSFTVESIAQRNLPYFEGKEYIEALKQKVTENLTVKVLFDKRKLDNYVLFSSLKERIKNVIIEIYNNYPGAIRLEPISIITPSVSNYINFPLENKSEFKVNLYGLNNPFGIEYNSSGTTLENSETITKYRNFTKTYKEYVVRYNNIEYPILGAIFPQNANDDATGIRLTVEGDPFGSVIDINDSANVRFYIKPKSKIYNDFFNNITDLAAFLLNKDPNTGDFVSEFVYPSVDDDGKLLTVKETLIFPMYDEFNIDMFSDKFDKYTTTLNDFSDSYDSVKTNLIARFLTTDSLKEFDTEDRKVNMLFQLYGKTFDDIKKYIDGITFMRNVSYDKIENVPDLLIKNYATMLGFNTFEIEDENTLIDSLFSTELDNVEKNTTPAEIDIEIWRRILINSIYLYKSKGTRKSIEFILKLVGLPDEIFEINEYIYLAERPLNTPDVLNQIYGASAINDPNLLLERVPFDTQGFPTVPLNVRYQENGGYLKQDKVNIGPFDFGQRYIREYRKFENTYLFDLYRTVDNVKSWVYNEQPTTYYKDDVNGFTEYESNHSKLTINSKELEVYLSSNRIFDISVYRQYIRNIGIVNSDLNILNKFNSVGLSFNQFIKKSLDVFINPKNRKTIKTYPTLSKIYFDYLKTTNTPIDSIRSLEFLNKFDSSWVKLIEQFVPATSIVNAGKKIQNSTFLDNKFVYRHGLNNDVSWLGTDGSEFQQKALKPVYLGTTNVTDNIGDINPAIIGDSPTFQITGKPGPKIIGTDPTINEYFGVHYTMFEYCDESEGAFHNWQSGVDYGDDTIFGGNINQPSYTSTPRYGVFVIYRNSLYRLNTKYLFQDTGALPDIHTAGTGSTIESRYPPNKATVTNISGDTKHIWEKIPIDADSRTITFGDTQSLNITRTERFWYMNSIGRGIAHIGIGIDFDCPPPRPHVCYYDFTGRTINIVTNTFKTFVDEEGDTQTVKQPKFYGFSRDYTPSKPIGLTYGSISKWATPYKKRFAWVDGEIYYKGEIIANIHATNKENLVAGSNVYIVTGDTVTGTTTYPTLPFTGLGLLATAITPGTTGTTVNASTITGDTPGGMYERYQDRTKTDPLMHIDTAYISKIKLDPNRAVYSINLTKSLNLLHIFSGATPQLSFKAKDNIINGELFISDSITANFDGFYSLDETKIGPFYTLNEDGIFIHTLENNVLLQPNFNNYISIQSLNENFNSFGNDLSLVNSNPGFYAITKSSYLDFKFDLYFESNENVDQTVQVKLINSLGFVYDTQDFTFNGENDADLRQYTFEYTGFFNVGEKVYLVITPIDIPCNLSRYEEIDYTHEEIDEGDYNALNDPRFRLLFYSGFSGRSQFLDGFSIKPIYNLTNLDTNNLILRRDESIYTNVPILNIEHSVDPNFLYNKFYLPYFDKNAQNEIIFDSSIYDKKINFDKINFSFKVRSKSPNLPTSGLIDAQAGLKAPGFKTAAVEYEFNYSDYYLGNSVRQTDYNDVTNAILIGKKVKPRKKVNNREFTYAPKYSFYDNVQLGTATGNTLGSFVSYDYGIGDYTEYNLTNNIVTELRNKKRYETGILGTTSYNLYALENDIYESEIYKKLLESVPEFNPQVVNYELNDVVKVPINDYKIVIDTPTGRTVETRLTYRLYVCINDIHPNHCYTFTDPATSTPVQGEIHEIYRPRGSRSCFIEIEKYNTANYTPWGYEHSPLSSTNNPNLIDYVNKNLVTYDASVLSEYNFGDLIIATISSNEEVLKFSYQKPLIWDSTKQYYRGDFILSGVTDEISIAPTVYRFFVARRNNKNQNPASATVSSPTTYWRRLTTTADLFEHKPLSEPLYGFVDSVGGSWFTLDTYAAYCTTAARFPKTLPVSSLGVPFIATGTTTGTGATVSGITFSNRWNSVLKAGDNSGFLVAWCFIDDVYTSFEGYDVNSVRKIIKTYDFKTGTATNVFNRYYGTDMIYKDYLPSAYVNTTVYAVGQIVSYNELPYKKLSTAGAGTTPKVGPDWEISYPTLMQSNSFYDTDNYTDYYGQTRLNKTNIKLKPSVRMNAQTTVNYIPFLTDSLDVYPLFERLGRLTEKNNPSLFNPTSPLTGITYNTTSLYLGYKYSVNRGVLYKFIGDTPISTYPDQPYADSTNWTERDFCLVNNFKFYKDRTRVTVFEASIESLTDSVKNSLYFYRPNLILKSGFTNRSFSGSTINNKLITALDKFYDITDTNRRTPTQNGLVDFRVSGNDVIMDYIPEKDEIGYPLTGEFIGKLRFSNPCGQTATTFFGILFDTDVTLLDRQQGLTQTANFTPEVAEILPYVVRVVVTQSGEANATLTINQVNNLFENATTSKAVSKNTISDDTFDVIPETDFEVSVSYSTIRNQTKFASAYVDGTPLFVNDQVINTNTIQTNLSSINSIETRSIKLKNLTSNRTIFINLDGVVSVTDVRTDVATPFAAFNIRSINIDTALL
jgi:hypothetical protein